MIYVKGQQSNFKESGSGSKR